MLLKEYKDKIEITNDVLKTLALCEIDAMGKSLEYSLRFKDQIRADRVLLNSHYGVVAFECKDFTPAPNGCLFSLYVGDPMFRLFVPSKHSAHRGYQILMKESKRLSSITAMPFSMLFNLKCEFFDEIGYNDKIDMSNLGRYLMKEGDKVYIRDKSYLNIKERRGVDVHPAQNRDLFSLISNLTGVHTGDLIETFNDMFDEKLRKKEEKIYGKPPQECLDKVNQGKKDKRKEKEDSIF